MNKLKEARKKRNVTQEELSKRTGIDHATISKIETGAMAMTMRSARIFGEALDWDPEDLIGGDAVRTIVVSADGEKERPFSELFAAFLRGYERSYREKVLRHAESAVFPNYDECGLFDLLRDFMSLNKRDQKKVDRLIHELTEEKMKG